MQVDYLPGPKSTRTPNLVVHVVLPTGTIKGVQVATNVFSPLLRFKTAESRKSKERSIGILEVHLSDDAVKMGCKLLKEMFEQENNAAGYDTYVQWNQTARSLGVHEEFPAEHLPKALAGMRDNRKAKQKLDDLLPKAASKQQEKRA